MSFNPGSTTQKIAQKAITAAINQDWEQAIKLNKQILVNRPKHIATLNRLAKAYTEVNQLDEAEKIYQHVLKIDKFNSIAEKNLAKLKSNEPGKAKSNPGTKKNFITCFIDEPGKTKTCILTKLANSDVISTLEPGQVLKLAPKNRWINVTTEDDVQIGIISDQESTQLKRCLDAGNTYNIAIKSISNNNISVFIKEKNSTPDSPDLG